MSIFCYIVFARVALLALHTVVVQGVLMDSNKSMFVQQLLVHTAP